MSKKKSQEYYDDNEYDEEEDWNEMSTSRGGDESDEDYEERMQDLYGDGWDS